MVKAVVREEQVDDESRSDFIDPRYALRHCGCPSYVWQVLNVQ